jgi:hypothetical protein
LQSFCSRCNVLAKQSVDLAMKPPVPFPAAPRSQKSRG